MQLNIEDLRSRIHVLKQLLDDPHPGVATWQENYEHAVRNILAFFGIDRQLWLPDDLKAKAKEWLDNYHADGEGAYALDVESLASLLVVVRCAAHSTSGWRTDTPPDRPSVIGYDRYHHHIGEAHWDGTRLVFIDTDNCDIEMWMPMPGSPKA